MARLNPAAGKTNPAKPGTLPRCPTGHTKEAYSHPTGENGKFFTDLTTLTTIDVFDLNLGIEDPDEQQRFILGRIPVNEQWNYSLGVGYKHFRDNNCQIFGNEKPKVTG
jgi:hypothetical protein